MIRKYTFSDLNAVVSLFTQSVHAISNYYSPEEIEAWAPSQPDMALWARYLDERYTLVMDSACGVIGFGCLSADGSTMDKLFTHPAHQSEGIGSSIMEALEKESIKRGAKKITLITSDNARKFHEKRGYIYHHSEKMTWSNLLFDCHFLCKIL
jgi:putative acetyltransferase